MTNFSHSLAAAHNLRAHTHTHKRCRQARKAVANKKKWLRISFRCSNYAWARIISYFSLIICHSMRFHWRCARAKFSVVVPFEYFILAKVAWLDVGIPVYIVVTSTRKPKRKLIFRATIEFFSDIFTICTFCDEWQQQNKIERKPAGNIVLWRWCRCETFMHSSSFSWHQRILFFAYFWRRTEQSKSSLHPPQIPF